MAMKKKKVGRPRKAESEKVVKVNTSYDPDNYRYIVQILDERKLEHRGHFVKIVNEIIADHKNVKQFKEHQAAKLKAQLDILEK